MEQVGNGVYEAVQKTGGKALIKAKAHQGDGWAYDGLIYCYTGWALKPNVHPNPPNASIARMWMKNKLLSIPQDGPAARSINSRSKSRKPLLWQRPAKGDTDVPGRQPAAATPGFTAP